MRFSAPNLLRLYVGAMCVWLLAPIVIVCILAFSGDGYLHFPPSSLSLRWFVQFLGNAQWQRAMLSSLIIGVIACVVSTTIGFFCAYAFLRVEFPGKKLLLSLMLTPIIVPNIITAIAMYYLAGKLRLIGNLLWLGLCHAVIALPIVLLILLSALHAVDPNLERAALGLGSSRTRVFLRVVLPIALPGVMSAALFAFLASFDELLISLFLSGVRTQTLPVRIWNSLNLQVEPTIAAVSAFLIAVTCAVLGFDGVLRHRRGQRRVGA
ncbi:MAG: ABC transporter permease [Acetobacteraceae bacterium]|jgi:ABC-type spermidine/putrescine transport system permease subunit II